MNYYINGEKVKQLDFEDELLDVLREYTDEHFDTFLDKEYGLINIMGIDYEASSILYKVDPLGYDDGLIEYFNGLYRDKMSELEREEEVTINGDKFLIAL